MFAYNGKHQVEVLLDKYKEYMKESSNDNSTKLIIDALQTHIEVIQLLIRGGADINLKDNEGHMASDFDYKAPTPPTPTHTIETTTSTSTSTTTTTTSTPVSENEKIPGKDL